MACSDEHQAMAEYYYDIGAVDSIELAEIGLMPQLARPTMHARRCRVPHCQRGGELDQRDRKAKRRRRPHAYAGFEGPRGV